MIAAGLRDKWVLLQDPGGSMPDGEGGYTEGWLPLDPPNAYVHISPMSQADLERAAAGTTIVTGMYVVDMDYHAQVTVKTRMEYEDPDRGTRLFQVTSVRNPNEDRRSLILSAVEILD